MSLSSLSPNSPIKELRAFVEEHDLGVKSRSKADLYEKIVKAMDSRGDESDSDDEAPAPRSPPSSRAAPRSRPSASYQTPPPRSRLGESQVGPSDPPPMDEPLVFGPKTVVILGPETPPQRGLVAEHEKLKRLHCKILYNRDEKAVRNQIAITKPTILYVLCHGAADGTFHQYTDEKTGKHVSVSSMEYIPICSQSNITLVLANCFAASLVTNECRMNEQRGLDMRSNLSKGVSERKGRPSDEGSSCRVWCGAGPNQTAMGIGFLNYLSGESACTNTLRHGTIHEIVVEFPADMDASDKPLASSRTVHEGEARGKGNSGAYRLNDEMCNLTLYEDRKQPSALNVLFGQACTRLLGNDARVRNLADVVDGTIVGVYFSAHWCPPCRSFTPILTRWYTTQKRNNRNLEIIFVSGDQDQRSFDYYFESQPWLAVPYRNARNVLTTFSRKHGVRGFPTLLFFDGKGKLIEADGRRVVQTGTFPGPRH